MTGDYTLIRNVWGGEGGAEKVQKRFIPYEAPEERANCKYISQNLKCLRLGTYFVKKFAATVSP
jgi:hypothetical protein